MTLAAAFFYLFAALTVAAGFMVIAAKNPVHAVLFLILAFFNAAGLFVLLGAGLILLVAMIGAIVLTLRHKVGVKRQSIAAQVARGPKTAVEVVKVASGSAIIPSAEGRG